MIIKQADDKSEDLRALQELATRTDVTPDVRNRIEQEIRNIRSGMKGEGEAAYEMAFHFGAAKNMIVIHDLRLECNGRIAQIDHLLIDRFLKIHVCESKRFGEGVAINEYGEFAAFYKGKPYGVPSPIEQNKRHIDVLEAVFRTGQVAPPTRLGFPLVPSLSSLVLVSKTARISRPKAKIDGLEQVIKNDQLITYIEKDYDKDSGILTTIKLVGLDTFNDFARRLVAEHKPIKFDWAAKFGLPDVVLSPSLAPAPAPIHQEVPATVEEIAQPPSVEGGPKKSKLICHECGAPVIYAVAKFCWFNKAKFNGNVYCLVCQKSITGTGKPSNE